MRTYWDFTFSLDLGYDGTRTDIIISNFKRLLDSRKDLKSTCLNPFQLQYLLKKNMFKEEAYT